MTLRLSDGRTLTAAPRGAAGAPRPAAVGRGAAREVPGLRHPRPAAREAEAVAEQIASFEAIPDIRALTARLVGDAE